VLDSFWPIVDGPDPDKEEEPMAAMITLTCSWGPQYQPTKAEVTGTREELCELMNLPLDSTIGALTEQWTQLHAHNLKNLSPGKG
jgi:hypothetical protein